MKMNQTHECPKILRSSFYALAIAVLSCSAGYAQEEDVDDTETFELSPFEVSTDSQIGYLATETLSGTRMRSELKDVAASIDVLTEEFLRDVGATDMYGALDFVGNVETWAKSGGISENENQVWFSSPYMARGFNTSAVSSDFFSMGQRPVDFYNLENFTVARGPNAILFGIGSPGGIVNNSRKRPLWGKDRVDIQMRTDEYGSFRSTLDITRELIDEKLAVRAAFVYDDRYEFLKPAAYLRKAAYAAVTYRPFKKTSITVTGETGNEFRIFQYTTTQYDGITPWINAGMPTFTGRGFAEMDTEFGSGLERNPRRILQINGQPEIPILNWQNMATGELFEIQQYPVTYLNGIRATSFTDETAIWDYEKIQLNGKSRQRDLDWKDVSVFITQELFVPELQLELAYNHVESEFLVLSSYGQFFLQIDPNTLLPNGDPNPNFGVPYVESERTEVIVERNTRDNYRATLSYDLDLNDNEILGIGLGRYRFMGLYEEERGNSLFAQFRRGFGQSLPGFPFRNIGATDNRVRSRTYVDTYLTPAGANVQPYFVEDFAPIDRDGLQDSWYRNSSSRDINNTSASHVLAVQAYLWKSKQNFERLILTYGMREDRQTSQRKEYRPTGGVFPGAQWRGSPWELDKEGWEAVWDGTLNYGEWGDVSRTTAPTKTYSAIFKPFENISLFYNYSDVVISASALFTDIYDRFVEGTVGETNDYGVRANFLDGKLVATLSIFETSAQNQREDSVRTIFTPELEDIWAAIDPAGAIHKGFNERYVTLRDDTSEGFEFSLVANLAPGWSTRLAFSRIETIIKSRLPIVDQYIAEFSPLWEPLRGMPLQLSDARTDYVTVGDALDNLYTDIADLHALENTAPNAQREWKVVLNTSYNFRDGFLEGFGIGGGFRWQSADVIGYAFDVGSLNDPARPVIVDSTKPFRGDELLNVSAFMSYTTTIKGIWMRFQVNVDNLFNEDGTFARSAVDDLTGNPYFGRQQVRQPRNFAFSVNFIF